MVDFARMSAAELNDWYLENVGYRPQDDDPTMTDDELRTLCTEVHDGAELVEACFVFANGTVEETTVEFQPSKKRILN